MRNLEAQLAAIWKCIVLAATFFLLNGCKNGAEEKWRAEGAAKEAWVKSNIKAGMTREEVIKVAGKPTAVQDQLTNVSGPVEGVVVLDYETGSPPPDIETSGSYGGFEVFLHDGKVTQVTILHEEDQ